MKSFYFFVILALFLSCEKEQVNPLTIPACKLPDNEIVTVSGEYYVAASSISCAQKVDYYQVSMKYYTSLLTIRIANKAVSFDGTSYPIVKTSDFKAGFATLSFSNGSFATSGSVFLLKENGKNVVQVCGAALVTAAGSSADRMHAKVLCP